MKLNVNALPPPDFTRHTSNTSIYAVLMDKSVGEWIELTEIRTYKAAQSKRNNLLSLVKRNNPLGSDYGITTAIRQANDGTWTLSICKIARLDE